MGKLKSFASKVEEVRPGQPVIEEFASEVRRMRGRAADMYKASNAFSAKMKREAEKIQGNVNLLRKSFEEFREKSNQAVRNRMRRIWGTHPPGTKVTDIL